MLSDICLYLLKLGQPFFRTDEDGYFLQLYNNYDLVCGQVPTLEQEEQVLNTLREELGLPESVKPKWFFPRYPPRVS